MNQQVQMVSDYTYATKEAEVVMLWKTLLLRLEGFGYGNQLLHDVYHLIRVSGLSFEHGLVPSCR